MTARPRAGGRSPRHARQATFTIAGVEGKLIQIARVALLATEVRESIQHMHKMRPDSAAVLRAASSWYTAAKHVGDSLDELKGAYISLGGYWEGRAFEAFQEYIKEDVIKTAERNEGTLFDIGDALVDVHNVVVDHYNEAVNLFTDTLNQAVGLYAEWQAATRDEKGARAEQLAQCLELFVSGIVQRKVNVDRAVQANQAAMTALRGQVQQIRAPGGVPEPVVDRRLWEPR